MDVMKLLLQSRAGPRAKLKRPGPRNSKSRPNLGGPNGIWITTNLKKLPLLTKCLAGTVDRVVHE